MGLVTRTDTILRPNPDRVMCRIFIPGEEELIRGTSRAKGVIARAMSLPDAVVAEVLDSTIVEFRDRHKDLIQQFELHFGAVAGLVDPDNELSEARRLLIGAYLTQEYAFEATAYFNPSMVPAPDQSGLSDGQMRFIMSIRAVGEGHISSMVFRSGMLDSDGSIRVDDATAYATTQARRYTVLRSKLVLQAATDAGLPLDDLMFVLGMLPDSFTPEELDVTLAQLHSKRFHVAGVDAIAERLQVIARSSYEVDFGDDTVLSERVIWPTASNERRGIEDARWVRFTGPGGETSYRCTYTGFDGQSVVPRVLETVDFRCFSSTDLTGPAALNKGIALFPRQVGGTYMALSRWDREANSIATSDDGYHWSRGKTFAQSSQPWELVQSGNCGSPMETEAGWLVITHGTGPMRKYVLGAILLDLDDPTVLLGSLDSPLLEPIASERNGYVPNVVYSCGGVIHGKRLILPYGFSDTGTRIATIDVDELLDQMGAVRPR